jgi:hypothetical protein
MAGRADASLAGARDWHRTGAPDDVPLRLPALVVDVSAHQERATVLPGRVGKLYLPPRGVYLGCRHCYEFTYESCQESHEYDKLWRHMGFEPGVA